MILMPCKFNKTVECINQHGHLAYLCEYCKVGISKGVKPAIGVKKPKEKT